MSDKDPKILTEHMEEELFKEVELVGKGTGLVASKDLPPGVLLLSESPLLTVPWWQRLAQFNRGAYFFSLSLDLIRLSKHTS